MAVSSPLTHDPKAGVLYVLGQEHESRRGWVLPLGLLLTQLVEGGEVLYNIGVDAHSFLLRILLRKRDLTEEIVELVDRVNTLAGEGRRTLCSLTILLDAEVCRL